MAESRNLRQHYHSTSTLPNPQLTQERTSARDLFWTQGFRPQSKQIGIFHGIQGEEGFAFRGEFVAKALTFSPWCRVRNDHGIGERRDQLITGKGAGGGGSFLFFFEAGEQQQTLFFKSRAPRGRKSQPLNTPCWANDNWLCAPEKDAQAFFFKWRMKAADHGNMGVTKRARQCVRLLNDRFRTLHGAEERNQRTVLGLMQKIKVAPRDHDRWDTISEIQPEWRRVADILLVDINRGEHIRLVSVSSQCFMRNYIQEQEVKMKLTLGVRVPMLGLWSDEV